MTITAAQRSAINRRNSKASTGPKSDEGKRRVSANALQHGMRAEKIALPHEDPAAIQARADDWGEACRPANPLEVYLLQQALKSSLALDRCRDRHTALLAKQVRAAPDDWDHEQVDEVERLKGLLETDPAAAVRLLARSAHGCRWLLGRWYRLDGILQDRGHWCGPDRDEAIRLLGQRPEEDRLVESEDAFKVRLFNLLCRPKPSLEAIDWLCDPLRMPESLRSSYRADFYPEAAVCLKALRDMIDAQASPLEDLEERLRTEQDVPDRAEAATRALIPLEEKAARLILRYQTTAENSFYRAYNALRKEQKERESGGGDPPQVGAAVVAAVVVAEDPPAAPEPRPNKANPMATAPAEDPAPPAPEALPNKANPAAAIPAEEPASASREPLPNKANPAAPGTLPDEPSCRRAASETREMTAGSCPGPGAGDGGGAGGVLDRFPELRERLMQGVRPRPG